MAFFPRPVSPKRAFSDFWAYVSAPHAHKWPLLGLSAAITWVIVWAFLIDSNTNTMPRQNKIFYFQSWNANRSDVDIIAQQKSDLARQDAMLRKKQKEMQAVADMFGVEWRKEEAQNSARREKELTAINALLDARLARAERKEGVKPTAAKPMTPPPAAAPTRP